MHLDIDLLHIVSQIFRHLLSQSSDKYALLFLGTFANLCQKVIDLSPGGAYADLRIEQPGRANDLFRNGGAVFVFVGTRSRGNEKRLVDLLLELRKGEGAIIKRGRQAKTIVNQYLLARAVAREHTAHLRQRDMRLVYHQQVIIWHVVHKRPGLVSRPASRQVARIVLDA